jgi:23S rRNA (adenine-N6)-dimethyltransferase
VPAPAPSGRRAAGWGWHRLTEAWAHTIVADARVGPGDLVLDVGAGTGALTDALAQVGARVIAVELHPHRLEQLRRRFARADVTVVRADASDLRLPRRPFHVVANPPFGATSQLLRRLLAPGSRLIGMHVVLQRAAAHRWADGRGPGAGRWLGTYEARVGRTIPRRAFVPPPPVDAAVLVMRRRR